MKCTLTDLEEVERIIGHPSVVDYISDDEEVDPELLAYICLSQSERFIVLMPAKDTLFVLTKINSITYEVHTCIVEGTARKKAIKNTLKAMDYMFNETPCEKIISYIPEFNRRATIFSMLCGMEKEGLVKKSFKKKHKVWDLILVGITKDQRKEKL